ncbi:hypothetical protein ACI3PL_20615, partial [Lacticaseibacillus paracasei]
IFIPIGIVIVIILLYQIIKAIITGDDKEIPLKELICSLFIFSIATALFALIFWLELNRVNKDIEQEKKIDNFLSEHKN